MTPKHVKSALKAYREARNNDTVSEEVLKERANICLACPARKRVTARPTDQISRILGIRANKEKVPDKIKDFKCDVCGCALMLLLPAHEKSLHKDSPSQAELRRKRAPHCWVPK